jgi:hypothetical protein
MRHPSLHLAASVTIGVVVGVMQAVGLVPVGDFPIYWRSGTELGALYSPSWLSVDPYVYPPVLAQVFGLFHMMPEPMVVAAWTTTLCVAVWYCAGRWAVPLLAAVVPAVVLGLPVLGEVAGYVLLGNVQLLVAGAIVLAMRRWPAAWAFVLLTKVGPGIGILWYAFRREWRPMMAALAATAAIAGLSVALAPQAWLDFAAFTGRNVHTPPPIPVVPIPFPALVGVAVAITWYGARTNRPWLVPIACGICSPALYQWSFVPIWIGALALWRAPEASPSRTARQGRLARTRGLALNVGAWANVPTGLRRRRDATVGPPITLT